MRYCGLSGFQALKLPARKICFLPPPSGLNTNTTPSAVRLGPGAICLAAAGAGAAAAGGGSRRGGLRCRGGRRGGLGGRGGRGRRRGPCGGRAAAGGDRDREERG